MINRFAVIVGLFLASAGSGVAQTLTLNMTRERVTPLDPLNSSIAIPIRYLITITSSDPLKNPVVTVTNRLPSAFRVVDPVECTAINATCPTAKIAVGDDNSVVINDLTIPAGASSAIELRVNGYYVAPSTKEAPFRNVVEARRQGETNVELTAKKEIAEVVSDEPLPIDLGVTKTVSPVGGTATPGVARTRHTFRIEVANAIPTDVYLSPFSLTDVFRPTGPALEATIDNFVCTHAACPTFPKQPIVTRAGAIPAFQLTWSGAGLLKAGDSFVLTFDATFRSFAECGAGSTSILNEAYLTRNDILHSIRDTNAANNYGTATVISSYSLPPCSLVGMKKTQGTNTKDPETKPVAWDVALPYTIEFTNTTGAAITNFTITDQVYPAATTPAFRATIQGTPTCTPSCSFTTTSPVDVAKTTKLFVATFPLVAAGQTGRITYNVKYQTPCDMNTVDPSLTIYNLATNSAGVSSEVATLMQPRPDCNPELTTTLKSANPAKIGEPVRFEVVYRNRFPEPVTFRRMIDSLTLATREYGDLPIIVKASSCEPSTGVLPFPKFHDPGTKLTVKFNSQLRMLNPTMPVDTPVTFDAGAALKCTFELTPQFPTLCQGIDDPLPKLINTAVLDTAEPLSLFSRDASADLPLCRSITVDKIAPSPQSFSPDQPIPYTIRVKNNNLQHPVRDILVDDVLPEGFTYVSSSCVTCSAAPQSSGGRVTASIPAIGAGATVDLIVVARAPVTGGSYRNEATAAFAQQGNFFTRSDTTLSSIANVQVLTPRLTKAFIPRGRSNQAEMVLTITNVPDNPAQTGIRFTDTLSPGIEFAGAPSTTCKVLSPPKAIGNAISFEGGLPGGMASCTITVPVRGAGCNERSNISNTANIDPSGVSAKLSVTDCPQPLVITKTVEGAPPGFREAFTFNATCATSMGLIQKKVSLNWPETTATIPGIPIGSTCIASEQPDLPMPPPGHAWVGVPIVTPADGVVKITKDGANTISFRNVMRSCEERGETKTLRISKQLEGIPAGFTGRFTFNVACASGASLITKQVAIDIPGSSTAAVDGLPPGSTCMVSEVGPMPVLPPGWFWLPPSYRPSSGQATLGEANCPEVVVINRASVCCSGAVAKEQ